MYTVEGADHIDLYDSVNAIPFDKLEQFFKEIYTNSASNDALFVVMIVALW